MLSQNLIKFLHFSASLKGVGYDRYHLYKYRQLQNFFDIKIVVFYYIFISILLCVFKDRSKRK